MMREDVLFLKFKKIKEIEKFNVYKSIFVMYQRYVIPMHMSTSKLLV